VLFPRLKSVARAVGAIALLAGSPVCAQQQGIDVSHHNGTVDWAEVAKAGVEFSFVKASEGVDAADPMFASHWQALGQQGIARGAYHFFVTEDDPKAQADFFLSLYNPQEGDLLPAIDIEVLGKGTGSDGPERLRAFLELIEKAVGADPIIYTSARFWDTEMARDPKLLAVIADSPLWIAQYEVDAPRIPDGWDRWTIWQWTPKAVVAGVPGQVDSNRLHPDVSLANLRVPAKPAPATPTR